MGTIVYYFNVKLIHLFAGATADLDQAYFKKVPENEAETERRFRESCERQIAKGDMERTFAALPARFQRVIDAGGKATKD